MQRSAAEDIMRQAHAADSSSSAIEWLKNSLEHGTAAQDCAGKLRQCLGLIAESTAATNAPASKGRPSARSSVKLAAARCKDAPRTALSTKEKRALATDIANFTLKLLSRHRPESEAPQHTKGRERTPLLPLSDTNKQSPSEVERCKPGRKVRPDDGPRLSTQQSKAVAECSHISFTYLRSQCQAFDPRLCDGSLVLCGRLISHNQTSMALKELSAINRMFDPAVQSDQADCRCSSGSTVRAVDLADHLHVDLGSAPSTDLLRRVIVYQNLVLKLAASQPQHIKLNNLLQYMLDARGSPAAVILRHMALTKDQMKAASYLDTLSATVLAVVPLQDEFSDTKEQATRTLQDANAILHLQFIALALKRQWWDLAGHNGDADKLAKVFSRAIDAFLRTSSVAEQPSEAYSKLAECYEMESLDMEQAAPFEIHRYMFDLAARSSNRKSVAVWLQRLEQDVKCLPSNHARNLTVVAKRVSGCLDLAPLADDITLLTATLDQSILGSASDSETLLRALEEMLLRTNTCEPRGQALVALQKLARGALRFSQRAWKHSPDRMQDVSFSILQLALRLIPDQTDLADTLREESVIMLVKMGTLAAVAQHASTMSMKSAWTCSRKAIMLSQVLKLLTLRAIRSSGTSQQPVTDMIATSSVKMGLVLEWQLYCALKSARSGKHKKSLQMLVPTFLDKLDALYSREKHPLRRRLVSIQAHLAHDLQLLREEHVKPWHMADVASEDLGDDGDLAKYGLDALACSQLVHILSQRNGALAAPGRLQPLEEALSLFTSIVKLNRNKAEQQFYDVDTTLQLLNCVAAWQQAAGYDVGRLNTLLLISSIQTCTSKARDLKGSASMIAEQLLYLGCGLDAVQICEQMSENCSTGSSATIQDIQALSILSEAYLHIGHIADSRRCADEGSQIGAVIGANLISSAESFELLRSCAKLWRVHSHLSLYNGSIKASLQSAKQSVRAVNSAWHRNEGHTAQLSADRPTDLLTGHDDPDSRLVAGVSKLNLKADDHKSADVGKSPGALYWSLIASSYTALIHLSDVYTHLGDFTHADVYSRRAIDLTRSLNNSSWAVRARAHRAILMVRAGSLDEAEMLLAEGDADQMADSVALVHHLEALAQLRSETGEVNEALKAIERAEKVSKQLYEKAMEALHASQSAVRCSPAEPSSDEHEMSSRPPKQLARRMQLRTKAEKPDRKPRGVRQYASGQQGNICKTSPQDWQRSPLTLEILLQKAEILYKLGHDASFDWLSDADLARVGLYSQLRQLKFRKVINQIHGCLRQDLRLNTFHETVMAFPMSSPSSAADTGRSTRKPKGRGGKSAVSQQCRSKITTLLLTARETVDEETPQQSLVAMADLRREKHCLVEVQICEVACEPGSVTSKNDAWSMAFELEYAGMIADSRQSCAHEPNNAVKSREMLWPTVCFKQDETASANDFKTEFVDILPASWTVASLHIDQAHTRLQVVRYRSGQPPAVVSLPFGRHESDPDHGELVDYKVARAELTDIINDSNRTCHAGQVSGRKGSKADWWREREELDRRLGLLLATLEEKWFGGFRGLLSTTQRSSLMIDDFRRALESVLHRHLQTSARQTGPQNLPQDQIIELLLNLSQDGDISEELESAVMDFLYFLLDSMRLQGADIVYDEIDFDSMVVEVCEAIVNSQGSAKESTSAEHLVLVLDKDLQNFPWESMPCLEGTSVSRVGSMRVLRQLTLRMRAQCDVRDDRASISWRKGSTILNPASDLTQTEAALSPSLNSLKREQPEWKLLVNQSPSEDDFSRELQQSSILLYFGHGSGAQYIRPQTVRRLKQCSEVVWLMGCSSGNVQEYGAFEPSSIPWSYLSSAGDESEEAGSLKSKKCLAVLANLWDVTDKDIDRFSVAVGEEWGLWSTSTTSSTPPIQHERPTSSQAVSTPVQPSKTPKTKQRANSVRSQSRTGTRTVRLSNRARDGLAHAVAQSRETCFLRYLNGAAPVVYGVPVHLAP